MTMPTPRGEAWPPSWLDAVRRRVRRWSERGAGASWVVAVSGGGDSVGLLRVLHAVAPELGLTLSVAHLDHGVRGEAAAEDAHFVENLAADLGLPFDLGRWQPVRDGHFEADARRARYEWLAQVALRRGATAVAVGHTRDDQAETILHRIIRGTGPRGLAGMPSRRVLHGSPPVLLLRPLLAVSRQDLRDGLRALGQGFREDASNADRTRTRAWIRLELLPQLKARGNPRVIEALMRLGSLTAASQRLTNDWLDRLESRVVVSQEADRIELRAERLRALPLRARVELLRRLWRRAGWPEGSMSAERWGRLARWAGAGPEGLRDVGSGVALVAGASADSVILRRAEPPALAARPEHLNRPLKIPGAVSWDGGQVASLVDPDVPRDETIDLDRVEPPLLVRAAVPGDRFAPLGMEGQSTPLNDFFRGRKLDPSARMRIPLVCDARGIIWVAGHRIADRVRLTASTTRRLGLRWRPETPPAGDP